VIKWLTVLLLLCNLSFAIERDGTLNLTSFGARGSKLFIIDFWASWCAPCKKSLPALYQLVKEYKDRDLQLITINVDEKEEDGKKLLRELRLTTSKWPVIYDPTGKLAAEVGVTGMPYTVLAKNNGKVIEVFSGFSDEKLAKLKESITGHLNGD
jgi:thiol-disulfide isomerase/thioredoxin